VADGDQGEDLGEVGKAEDLPDGGGSKPSIGDEA
jgi:hypothetical protein